MDPIAKNTMLEMRLEITQKALRTELARKYNVSENDANIVPLDTPERMEQILKTIGNKAETDKGSNNKKQNNETSYVQSYIKRTYVRPDKR